MQFQNLLHVKETIVILIIIIYRMLCKTNIQVFLHTLPQRGQTGG